MCEGKRLGFMANTLHQLVALYVLMAEPTDSMICI